MNFEAIPTLALIFGFVAFCVYMDYRVKMIKARSSSNGNELEAINARLEQKTKDLEERIKVLESIVTGKQYRLKEDIDSL